MARSQNSLGERNHDVKERRRLLMVIAGGGPEPAAGRRTPAASARRHPRRLVHQPGGWSRPGGRRTGAADVGLPDAVGEW